MSDWKKGRPTEPGPYWVGRPGDPEVEIVIGHRDAGGSLWWQGVQMDADDWHLPIERPDPPRGDDE